MLLRLEKRSPQTVIQMIEAYADPEWERYTKTLEYKYQSLLDDHKDKVDVELDNQ